MNENNMGHIPSRGACAHCRELEAFLELWWSSVDENLYFPSTLFTFPACLSGRKERQLAPPWVLRAAALLKHHAAQ